MVVSSILAIRSGTDENMAKKKELWEYVKKTNPRLYIRLRFGFLGQGMNLPAREEDRSPLPDTRSHRSFLDLTDPVPPDGKEKERAGRSI